LQSIAQSVITKRGILHLVMEGKGISMNIIIISSDRCLRSSFKIVSDTQKQGYIKYISIIKIITSKGLYNECIKFI